MSVREIQSHMSTIRNSLLGHSTLTLHAIVLISLGYVRVLKFEHALPPFFGGGLSQRRYLDCFPVSPPQLFEQEEYGPHGPHCPFAKNFKSRYLKLIFAL